MGQTWRAIFGIWISAQQQGRLGLPAQAQIGQKALFNALTATFGNVNKDSLMWVRNHFCPDFALPMLVLYNPTFSAALSGLVARGYRTKKRRRQGGGAAVIWEESLGGDLSLSKAWIAPVVGTDNARLGIAAMLCLHGLFWLSFPVVFCAQSGKAIRSQ